MEKNPQFMALIKKFQRNEITEHIIYQKIAKSIKSEEKRKIIEQIANDEKSHHDFWKSITNEEVKPDTLKIFFYTTIMKLFGVKRGVRIMEKGEQKAQFSYTATLLNVPQSQWIIDDEVSHENKLINILSES